MLVSGALHQHGVHHAETRRGKGRALPRPDRHLQGERERGVHGALALSQLPDQSLQGLPGPVVVLLASVPSSQLSNQLSSLNVPSENSAGSEAFETITWHRDGVG